MHPFRATLLTFAMATAVLAQAMPVGTRTVSWANTSGVGSPQLLATVHYPAVVAGTATPVLPHPGGWPVIVFLHGFGWIGADYAALANAWTAEGFVVVLADTCQWDWVCQEADARAMHGAIVAANLAAASPFTGAFDVQRIALTGHSMGGSTVGNVLAANPGYRCGLTMAPVTPLVDPTPIAVPFGIVVGTADTITPPSGYAQLYYDAISPEGGLKFCYLLDATCDHMNLVGLVGQPWSAQTTAVFERTMKVGRGFLQQVMEIDPTGLEVAIGAEALAEPMLVSLQRHASVPQVWLDRELRIGGTSRISVAVEGVLSLLMGSAATVPAVPTPFGAIGIDPTTAFPIGIALANADLRADFSIAVNQDPTLIGLPLAMQSLCDDAVGEWVLSNSWLTFVGP